MDRARLWKNARSYQLMQTIYDSELAKIEIPYQSRFVHTRHGETHVITAGNPDHPALVLWHGMNASAISWINEINTFGAEYYVIVPDCPGDTGRSAPQRLNRKTMAHGEWAADLLETLAIPQAHHIGISGGGWLIFKLANIAPERITSAILISAGGLMNANLMLLLKMLPAMLVTPPDKLANRFVRMMGVPGREPSAGELQMFELMFQFKTENGVPLLPDKQIQALTAPTMLLMAEHEQAFKPPQKAIARAKRLLPALLHAEVVAGVSHGMNGDDPVLFARKIREFLAQVAQKNGANQ